MITKPGVEKTPSAAEKTDEQVPEVEVEAAEPTVEIQPDTEHDVAWWKARANAIEKENKKAVSRLAALEKDAQARADAEKSELQKAQDRADKAEAEARKTRLDLLRRDAATNAKLPLIFADRIKGETLEEMETDAAAMLAAMPVPVAPKLNTTNPGRPQTGETEADKRRRLGLD